MNKLLFVDDDYIIIRSYIRLIDWKRLDIATVYSATNAEEAKKIIIENRPNILISDIEMPGLSGLELTKWIRERELNIKVIFLSAYDNFSYAQTAVHLNCVEYLLKPVSVEGLSAAVESAIDAYDNELYQEEYEVLAKYWLENCDVVYEHFWHSVLTGTLSTKDSIYKEASNLGIELHTTDTFSLFLFRVYLRRDNDANSPLPLLEDLQQISRSYFLGKASRSFIFHMNGEICAAVLVHQRNEKLIDIEYLCKGLMDISSKELTVPVLVVGIACPKITELAESFAFLSAEVEHRTADKTSEKNELSIIERIKIYVAEHLSEDISKFSVAEYVCMNPDYVSKIFKRETGLSIPDFITQQKLYRARRLLLQTSHSISQIATELGYTNFSYFTKLFCHQFNCTPKEYRKKYLKQ